MIKEMTELLLRAPDYQMDAKMKPLIKKWSDPPTPLQILEVLDQCINGSLANGLVVKALQIAYDETCKYNHTSHEEVVKLATWRKDSKA